jgi:aldehyde dehydrogenase (NAD+)
MHHIPFETAEVFIAGRWRPCARGGRLMLLNPSDGSLLAEIARGVRSRCGCRGGAAQAALDGAWGGLTATERGRLLLKMSALVLEQADELARLEALDVGKPLKQGRADAVALARYLEFYGGAADKVMARRFPSPTATPRSRCASRTA